MTATTFLSDNHLPHLRVLLISQDPECEDNALVYLAPDLVFTHVAALRILDASNSGEFVLWSYNRTIHRLPKTPSTPSSPHITLKDLCLKYDNHHATLTPLQSLWLDDTQGAYITWCSPSGVFWGGHIHTPTKREDLDDLKTLVRVINERITPWEERVTPTYTESFIHLINKHTGSFEDAMNPQTGDILFRVPRTIGAEENKDNVPQSKICKIRRLKTWMELCIKSKTLLTLDDLPSSPNALDTATLKFIQSIPRTRLIELYKQRYAQVINTFIENPPHKGAEEPVPFRNAELYKYAKSIIPPSLAYRTSIDFTSHCIIYYADSDM